MTYLEYITDHLLPSWVQQWTCNFNIWADLITSNYEGYAFLEVDHPEHECYDCFWAAINTDDILPKECLEHFYQRINDIDTAKVKTVPAEDVLRRIKELVDDMGGW